MIYIQFHIIRMLLYIVCMKIVEYIKNVEERIKNAEGRMWNTECRSKTKRKPDFPYYKKKRMINIELRIIRVFFLLYILRMKNVECAKNVECRMKIKEWRIKIPFPLLQDCKKKRMIYIQFHIIRMWFYIVCMKIVEYMKNVE